MLLGLLPLLLTPTAAATLAPERLIAGLAQPAPAHTAFVEVRYVGVLTRPLILHGKLVWLGGAKLERDVAAPYRETTTISGDQVRIVRPGQPPPQTIDLGRAPELKGLLTGFRALLSGDAALLRATFAVSASGDARAWTLELKPRDAALARRLAGISVDGSGHRLRCLRMDQSNGDTSFTLLGALAATALPAAPTPAALATLCAGGPAS